MPASHDQANIDHFRITRWTRRHRRLLPRLVAVAEEASHHYQNPRVERRAWDQTVVGLTDQPSYDGRSHLDDAVVAHGNLEGAVQSLISEATAKMIGSPNPMAYDVAVAYRYWIVGVVRTSPGGPVVTRLDTCPSPSGEGAGPRRELLAPMYGDVPKGCAGSPPSRRGRWRGMRTARRWYDGRWMSSVATLINTRTRRNCPTLPAHVFDEGGLRAGLEAAIAVACEMMLPAEPGRAPLHPRHQESLAADVGQFASPAAYTPSSSSSRPARSSHGSPTSGRRRYRTAPGIAPPPGLPPASRPAPLRSSGRCAGRRQASGGRPASGSGGCPGTTTVGGRRAATRAGGRAAAAGCTTPP